MNQLMEAPSSAAAISVQKIPDFGYLIEETEIDFSSSVQVGSLTHNFPLIFYLRLIFVRILWHYFPLVHMYMV